MFRARRVVDILGVSGTPDPGSIPGGPAFFVGLPFIAKREVEICRAGEPKFPYPCMF